VRKDLQYNNIYEEYYKTISSIFFLLWKNKYIPDQEIRGIIYTNHHDFISSFGVFLPILDDDNIANIFAQKRQKLHSQIMVSENLILLQLASAILWMLKMSKT
jgi:hypothetical protein